MEVTVDEYLLSEAKALLSQAVGAAMRGYPYCLSLRLWIGFEHQRQIVADHVGAADGCSY